MIKVNALGDPCPIPVVKTKNAIKELNDAGEVEILVDNEVAVQNLTKMATQKGYGVKSAKLEDQKFQVIMSISEEQAKSAGDKGTGTSEQTISGEACIPDARQNIVVAISSDKMGEGAEELGHVLMKAFIFALTQQNELPQTILFYNSGAHLTCKDSPLLEDLKGLEAQGVEVLTCGTCLNFYGLQDELQLGGVTNMYDIVEKMMKAGKVIKP